MFTGIIQTVGKLLARRDHGGDCTLKVYEKLYHELLNEPERNEVMQDIDNWLSPFFA